MAMLEEELLIICKHENIKWPILFKRFRDNGFGIMNGNKKDLHRKSRCVYGFLYLQGK